MAKMADLYAEQFEFPHECDHERCAECEDGCVACDAWVAEQGCVYCEASYGCFCDARDDAYMERDL